MPQIQQFVEELKEFQRQARALFEIFRNWPESRHVNSFHCISINFIFRPKLEDHFEMMDYDKDGFVDLPEISMYIYDHFRPELGKKTLDEFAQSVTFYATKFQARRIEMISFFFNYQLVIISLIPCE